jgi:hypothetical protein
MKVSERITTNTRAFDKRMCCCSGCISQRKVLLTWMCSHVASRGLALARAMHARCNIGLRVACRPCSHGNYVMNLWKINTWWTCRQIQGQQTRLFPCSSILEPLIVAPVLECWCQAGGACRQGFLKRVAGSRTHAAPPPRYLHKVLAL